MNKIKTLAGAMLLLIALLATSTVWAQTAAPTKPTSKEQYTQMLKDKQAQMAKQRADRAAQPRKAKATTTAAKAVKDDPALKAQKEAAQTTTVTRKAKAYVPTEADKKAAAEKMAKGGVATKATTNRTVKPYVPTEADKKATAEKMAKKGIVNVKNTTTAKVAPKQISKPIISQSEPKKEMTWQEIAAQKMAEKEAWIAKNPAAYQAQINQPKTVTTITKAQLHKMSEQERARILARPNEFKIVE